LLVELVELVRAGRGVSELAREFGCNVSGIHAWVKAAGDVAAHPSCASRQ
jgi:transposase-like protein